MKKNVGPLLIIFLLIPTLVLGATLIITNKPLNSENPETYLITGNVLYKQSDYHKAIASFDKAVKINPLYEEARNNLAFLYNKVGDYKKAAAQLEELVEINPANPSYHYDYAINLVMNIKKTKQGTIEDIETAIQEFSTADQLEPGFLNAKENIEFLGGMRQEYYEKKSMG
ncbi:tetratricopeptide repeat protein [Candidatus Woesearchaeota archaeon]|nr:tetratricopeptide repeat protein [Candidatus Woesearchaeota archaeon]